MAGDDDLYAFGPFLLDASARRLTRNGERVHIGGREFDVLHTLVSRPGEVISKEALVDAAWRDVAVTIGSVDQALYLLRQRLTMPSGQSCIQTHARRGVRFVPPVSRVRRHDSAETIESVLERHGAWIDGRAALETLEALAITNARAAFERVVRRTPQQATAHVGLANACALQFETTRTDAQPDVAALEIAFHHAAESCRLNPKYGEAWATLGFVLERMGRRKEALSAAREAIELEPDNWRHHLRLSAAAWGEERLREARRTLALVPRLAIPHWLAATVLVARGSLDDADAELAAGLTDSGGGHGRFAAIALHWLRGLIALAKGDSTCALECFACELQHEHRGHLYAKEVAANTWYAIGATRLRQGDDAGGRAAFEETLARVPTHATARAALGLEASASHSAVDAAIARAVAFAARRDYRACDAEAAAIERALENAPEGNAAWLLSVEPILAVSMRPEPWSNALACVHSRAT